MFCRQNGNIIYQDLKVRLPNSVKEEEKKGKKNANQRKQLIIISILQIATNTSDPKSPIFKLLVSRETSSVSISFHLFNIVTKQHFIYIYIYTLIH